MDLIFIAKNYTNNQLIPLGMIYLLRDSYLIAEQLTFKN